MQLARVMAAALLVSACGPREEVTPAGAAAITAEGLASHIRVLASDEFEGRGPATAGEEKTIAYLRDQFRDMGLAPANGDSYFQQVPVVSITLDPAVALVISGGSENLNLAYKRDMMVWTKHVVERVALEDSELVFAGYGIVAPEYDWNDYQALDVAGKTVVLLVNDPGFAGADPRLFNGRAMTYYGRWTYKFEEAARQGAAAALIVHEADDAGYPWGVVSGSWSGPQFDLVRPDQGASRLAVEGWLTLDSANRLFAASGRSYKDMKAAALESGFEPVALGQRVSVQLENTFAQTVTNNVAGVVPGSARPDEYVLYMAHWDHMGVDPSIEGDGIFNGAFDNASGTAALLELAGAFAALDPGPERSVLFVAVTAEEQGLLGSAHYAENPLFPLAQTVAAVNIDGLNAHGRTHDIAVVGFGNSELEGYLEAAAAVQNRVIVAEPFPEKGYFYRSDHFSLAKKGVPALYTESGVDHVEHGRQFGLDWNQRYTAERYHKPADEYDESWDLSGGVEDTMLFFEVGRRIADETTFPNWYPGNEFRAIRDAARP